MFVDAATPRRGRNRSSKKQETVPKDLEGFVVGRLPSDRPFRVRNTLDLSDGESEKEVILTPSQREALAKEVEDLTMSPTTLPAQPPSSRLSRERRSHYSLEGYCNEALYDDDDEEPLWSQYNFEYKNEHKDEHNPQSFPLGTISSPIEILDSNDEAPPKKRSRLIPYSLVVKKEKDIKVERTASTTPCKIESDSLVPALSKTSSRSSNDLLLLNSTLVSPNLKVEVEELQTFQVRSKPQMRRSRRRNENCLDSVSPISRRALRSQKATKATSHTTPAVTEHRRDSIDNGVNTSEDLHDTRMHIVTLDDSLVCIAGIAATTRSSNTTIPSSEAGAQYDWQSHQVFALAKLAEVHIPVEFKSTLSRSDTGLSAFLQLAKTRIMQKIDAIYPLDMREQLQDICGDGVGKEAWMINRDD